MEAKPASAYKATITAIREASDKTAREIDGAHTRLLLSGSLDVMLACKPEEGMTSGQRAHIQRLHLTACKLNAKSKALLEKLDKLSLEYVYFSTSLAPLS